MRVQQRVQNSRWEPHNGLINLTPGTYAVTFTLPGFSVVKREGLEVSAGVTVTVNAAWGPSKRP